jgi:hypothetical protein
MPDTVVRSLEDTLRAGRVMRVRVSVEGAISMAKKKKKAAKKVAKKKTKKKGG